MEGVSLLEILIWVTLSAQKILMTRMFFNLSLILYPKLTPSIDYFYDMLFWLCKQKGIIEQPNTS
jgi:hypothetical protein